VLAIAVDDDDVGVDALLQGSEALLVLRRQDGRPLVGYEDRGCADALESDRHSG
jgi:hypothetical protein